MLTVTAGNIAVQFENASDWFPRYITRNGSGVSSLNSSVNGCVLQINGVFAGGDHGSTTVVNTHLTVDGTRRDFANGDSYTGLTATFSRTINYSGVALLDHTMRIKEDRIDESFRIRTIASGYNITIFYASLRSFENRFSGYRVYNESGLLSGSGNVVLNNDANVGNLTHPLSVHMFDAIRGHNVITTISAPDDATPLMFIDDRANDNKLYFSFTGWTGITTNKRWQWGQVMRFYG